MALERQEPDRVPFDCTFTYGAYQKLIGFSGFSDTKDLIPKSPALNISPNIGFLEEMKIDLYYLGLNSWKNEPAFEIGAETYQDVWGVGYRKIEGPTGMEYFNDLHPLAQAKTTDLDHYPSPSLRP